ncbi:MAG: dolichyl-phosphate-mannose-protein mannosyltransferase [Actinomycetota bacterium]|nr:dolichyl-phosphate-mannose-protein mannosyltransferase [Actinomycetota bacterium]
MAVTTFGAVLRFARLAYPNALVFDEVYYAKDACLYLAKGMRFCGTPAATEQSFVHPPLGKWIIAVGIRVFGFNSFGWRFMAAVFGTAMIPIAFLIGRKLFGRWGGVVTGLLVATDFLLIVQSRAAMLDIFLAFFVVLGFLFVVLERERVARMRDRGGGGLDLRWRLAAGASFGAAASVKWSGAYAFAAGGFLVIFWTVGTALAMRRAEAPGERPRAPGPLTELNFTIVAMAFPFVAVYLLSYSVWFYDHHFSFSQFQGLQSSMLQYHLHLTQKHTYASPAWKWPLLWRPVAYYFTGGAKATHILAVGNPATWWPALAAGVWMAVQAFRYPHTAEGRRIAGQGGPVRTLSLRGGFPDFSPAPPRRSSRWSYLYGVLWAPATLVILAWLVQYLPWANFSRPQFFFYMAPIVPFMMLALAAMLRDIVRGYLRESALMASCLGAALLALAALLLFVHPFGFGVDLAGQRRIVEVAGVPILVLGLALALGYSEATAIYRKALVGVYLALACGVVLYYFYPVIAAWAIPFTQWQHRMLFPTWI